MPLPELVLLSVMSTTGVQRTEPDLEAFALDVTGATTSREDVLLYREGGTRMLIESESAYEASRTPTISGGTKEIQASALQEALRILQFFSNFPIDDEAQELFDIEMAEANQQLQRTLTPLRRAAAR